MQKTIAVFILLASCAIPSMAAPSIKLPGAVQPDDVWLTVTIATDDGPLDANLPAGLYTFSVDPMATGLPGTLNGFCIEIDQSNPEPGTSPVYDITPLKNAPLGTGGPMGPDKADAISLLWTLYGDQIGTNAPAFQAAVWEIVYEDTSLYGWDFTDGNIAMIQTAGTPDCLVAAKKLLEGVRVALNDEVLSGAKTPRTSLIALTNPDLQDYVVAVPAPAAAILVLLGIGTVGWARKRVA